METAMEKYFNKLALYREIFSNISNDIDVKLDALSKYEMMLNNRDQVISEYSVEIRSNKHISSNFHSKQ